MWFVTRPFPLFPCCPQWRQNVCISSAVSRAGQKTLAAWRTHKHTFPHVTNPMKTLTIQLVAGVMPRGSVKGCKEIGEEKPEGPETSRKKPSRKFLLNYRSSLSFPIYKSIHYAYRYLSKCMNSWRGLWINDIWITHNILSLVMIIPWGWWTMIFPWKILF